MPYCTLCTCAVCDETVFYKSDMKKHTITSLFTKLIFLVAGLCILWLLVCRDRPSIGMLLLRYEGGGKILQDMSYYATPTMSEPVDRRRKIIIVAYPRKHFIISYFSCFKRISIFVEVIIKCLLQEWLLPSWRNCLHKC